MFPHPEDQADYEYPEGGLLQAFGVIQPDEIRNPSSSTPTGKSVFLSSSTV
jgi:hypothetical protein